MWKLLPDNGHKACFTYDTHGHVLCMYRHTEQIILTEFTIYLIIQLSFCHKYTTQTLDLKKEQLTVLGRNILQVCITDENYLNLAYIDLNTQQ